MNWQKQHHIYERKAYTIVQKHIKKILSSIPVDNMELYNYEILITINIHQKDVYDMFVDIYKTIGLNYGNKVNNSLEKVKKANVLFNETLLKEILLFLSTEGGVKITSVRDTLIKDIIDSIKKTLGDNGTVIDLRNAIYEIISKSQTFYKWQALRIARTETTSASGLSAMITAQQSDLVLQKKWISVNDNRTRLDHRIEDNQVVDLEQPFIMQSGAVLQYPGDTSAPANEVINCRCTMAFIPKRDADGNLILKT